MKIAYKPYSKFPDSKEMKSGIPSGWPALMKSVDDSFSENGWTVVSNGEYDLLLASLAEEKEEWNAVNKPK